MPIKIFGIKNCDSVKKARAWLDSHSIDYRFHDFRTDGLSAAQVQAWVAELGWETLINKRSTTWKQLDTAAREALTDESVIDVILAQPTLIKRPLLDTGDQRRVGFKAADYAAWFSQSD